MRHIPEEELHAYLDQGLSRSQCVEIESHLAECSTCRAARDSIAALRDRTTALLARLAPPRAVRPGFELLRARAAAQAHERRRRLHVAAWAASLVAATGLGWTASAYLHQHGDRAALSADPLVTAPAAPAPQPGGPATPLQAGPPQPSALTVTQPHDSGRPPARLRPARASLHVAPRSDDSAADAAHRAATLSVLDPKPAVELTRLEEPGRRSDVEFDGIWRTISLDGARGDSGGPPPHIDGLPVVGVQVQSGELGPRPVTVVVQKLASGQVIRTIAGPAGDVSQLLSRSGMDSLATPSGLQAPGGGHTMAMQVGDRMLAISGDLPSDSLRAMIRRLNAEMRSK